MKKKSCKLACGSFTRIHCLNQLAQAERKSEWARAGNQCEKLVLFIFGHPMNMQQFRSLSGPENETAVVMIELYRFPQFRIILKTNDWCGTEYSRDDFCKVCKRLQVMLSSCSEVVTV